MIEMAIFCYLNGTILITQEWKYVPETVSIMHLLAASKWFQTSNANHDIFTSWWHNHLCFNKEWPWPWQWFRSETTVNDSRSWFKHKNIELKIIKMERWNEFLFLINVTKFITSFWLVFEVRVTWNRDRPWSEVPVTPNVT